MSGRKWKLGGVAGAVALAWGVGAAQGQMPPAGGQPPAVVNGEVIPLAALEASLGQAGPSPVQQPEAQRRQTQMQALSGLIDRALMRQFLAKNAKPADPAEVNQKIKELDAALRKQGKTLQDFYRDMHQTEGMLRESVAEMLQWYAYAKDRLTDADVEQYYKEYKDFFDRVQVRASHIVLRLPATATESERAQARAKLADLRAQIVGGKLDFAEAAKAHSQCPTADKGGDIGWFPRKWVVEEPFAKAAFALQVGQVSDVVESDYGLHLIKVTDRKAGQPSDFAKIKDEVREICIEDMQQNVLMQQRKAAKIEIHLP
jgi:parvulin-like peptidyl-prolyl isomerase